MLQPGASMIASQQVNARVYADLKERLFGLTNNEGNHGEDAKEYWWAVDGTPTHSWMQWL